MSPPDYDEPWGTVIEPLSASSTASCLMAARTEPLSIESLLKKQKAEKDAASKGCIIIIHITFQYLTLCSQPKFLSKEERAKIAIAKRAQEIKEQREREQKSKKDREALEKEAEEIRQKERSQSNRYDGGGGRSLYSLSHLTWRVLVTEPLLFHADDDRYGHPERDRQDRRGSRYGRDGKEGRESRDRRPPLPNERNDKQPPPQNYQNVPTGPRADRGKPASNGAAASFAMPPPPLPYSDEQATLPDSTTSYAPSMTENDLSAIRSRYLGVDRKKRKIRKMNDRKFVFDWDAQDDTYADDSPIAVGSNRQGAQVMFGRGRLAGMDDGGNGSRKPVTEFEMRLADPMERRKAAKAGLDERHWTDKPLSEMKERDWRIFREDFSISARGGQIPHPLRSWEESTIPKLILGVINEVGYKEPSPIQRQAIPIGLQNRDIIGIAETGTIVSTRSITMPNTSHPLRFR